MKKANWKVLVAIALAVSLVAIILALTLGNSDDDKNAKKVTYGTTRSACEMLSSFTAKSLMGQEAKPAGKNVLKNASSGIRTTSCSYTNGVVTATLSLQAPQDKSSLKEVQATFNDSFGNVREADKILAYGGKGYWDSAKGELVIFNNNTLFTITYGPSAAASRNLSQTEELADVLVIFFKKN